MHKVLLAVRIINREGITGYASRELELTFQPFVGLRFENGSSRIWRSHEGLDPAPEVERVIYDIQQEQLVCLFTVNAPLSSPFWQVNVAKEDAPSALTRHFQMHPIRR